MAAALAHADSIDEETAIDIAQRFLSHRQAQPGNAAFKSKRLVMADTAATNAAVQPLAKCYLVTRGDSDGFVLVADDDRLNPILGYSLTGRADHTDIPLALQIMLQNHAARLDSAKNSPVTEPAQVGPLEPGNIIVPPCLKTQWSQDEPYNWLTPLDKGKHTPTGCVPTAATQVMNYYKWPPYSPCRQYDWQNMRDTYDNYSHAQGMAVATLMRDIGAVLGTRYRYSGSSTGTSYWKIPGYISKTINREDFNSYINKGPLLISIYPIKSESGFAEGHAVILDGLDSNDYYHVNWGWGGLWDGFYSIDDMAIEYANKEQHPHINKDPEIASFLKPAAPGDEGYIPSITLHATGGVTVNRSTAADGDEVEVTLHGVRKLFDDTNTAVIGLKIYKGPKQYGEYYDPNNAKSMYYGQYGSTSTTILAKVTREMQNQPTDITLKFTMGWLAGDPLDGDYFLVPVCTYDDHRDVIYYPFLYYPDGNVNSDIPFRYENKVAYFEQFTPPSYDVTIEKVVTASQYHAGAESQALAHVTNKSANDFTGKATLKFTKDSKTTVTLDTDVFIPANTSSYTTVYLPFTDTGSYQLKSFELWKSYPDGTRTSYKSGTLTGSKTKVVATEESNNEPLSLHRYMQVRSDADTVYRYQRSLYSFNLYTYNATKTTTVALEAVATAIGKNTQAIAGTQPDAVVENLNDGTLSSQTMTLSTDNLTPGDYLIVGFYSYNNNTYLMLDEQMLSEIDPASHQGDQVLHVLDPGIDVAQLKVISSKPLDKLYFDTWSTLAVEIQNTGTVDVISKTSIKQYNYSAYVSHLSAQFLVKAGEKAMIYPRVYMAKQNYKGEDNPSAAEFHLEYVLNNGKEDISFPFGGKETISVNFEAQPTGQTMTFGDPVFYYRSGTDETRPSTGFYSAGKLKRSIYKNGKKVLSLNEMTTDNSYNTYRVFPTLGEVKSLANGEYAIKLELTKSGESKVSQTYIRPLIIDDNYISLTVDDVTINKEHDLKPTDDIPFRVKITNAQSEPVTTALYYYLIKPTVEDGQTHSYIFGQRYSSASLPASAQSTFNLATRIDSKNYQTNGEIWVQVNYNRRKNSGALDIFSGKQSDKITLPFKSAIEKIGSDNSQRKPVAYYDVNGRHLAAPVQGIVIVKYDDGSTEKMLYR